MTSDSDRVSAAQYLFILTFNLLYDKLESTILTGGINMIYDLMVMAANAPQTGDDFPARKLMVIGVAAAVVAVGSAIFAIFKKDSDKKD